MLFMRFHLIEACRQKVSWKPVKNRPRIARSERSIGMQTGKYQQH
jgi:hypothetical protein